jgi:hypothetical protein
MLQAQFEVLHQNTFFIRPETLQQLLPSLNQYFNYAELLVNNGRTNNAAGIRASQGSSSPSLAPQQQRIPGTGSPLIHPNILNAQNQQVNNYNRQGATSPHMSPATLSGMNSPNVRPNPMMGMQHQNSQGGLMHLQMMMQRPMGMMQNQMAPSQMQALQNKLIQVQQQIQQLNQMSQNGVSQENHQVMQNRRQELLQNHQMLLAQVNQLQTRNQIIRPGFRPVEQQYYGSHGNMPQQALHGGNMPQQRPMYNQRQMPMNAQQMGIQSRPIGMTPNGNMLTMNSGMMNARPPQNVATPPSFTDFHGSPKQSNLAPVASPADTTGLGNQPNTPPQSKVTTGKLETPKILSSASQDAVPIQSSQQQPLQSIPQQSSLGPQSTLYTQQPNQTNGGMINQQSNQRPPGDQNQMMSFLGNSQMGMNHMIMRQYPQSMASNSFQSDLQAQSLNQGSPNPHFSNSSKPRPQQIEIPQTFQSQQHRNILDSAGRFFYLQTEKEGVSYEFMLQRQHSAGISEPKEEGISIFLIDVEDYFNWDYDPTEKQEATFGKESVKRAREDEDEDSVKKVRSSPSKESIDINTPTEAQ